MYLYSIQITVIVVFALLSAFFSGSETAFFSLKKSDLHRYSISDRKREKDVYRLMADPQQILITLLSGNLFVNLAITELSTYMLLNIWDHYGHFISIGVVTPLLIIFCEITPKLLAYNSYKTFANRSYPLLKLFHNILYPFRILLISITNVFIKLFRLQFTHKQVTEAELGHAVRIGQKEGVIEKAEGLIIQNVIRFSKKEASNIMFPRNNAVFIPYGASIEDSLEVFLETKVIRAPVYKNDYDHIVGFVDSREMMPYFYGYRKARNINKFIHKIHFFPSTRSVNDLLKDFLTHGIQIAVVVDEYGGTDGIVTLNSILMELMGKDTTKWEVDYKPEIRKIDDEISVISGSMQIDDFNFNFGDNIFSVDSDSVGGYIMEMLSSLPRRGQEVLTGKHILRVRYLKKNKIETVEVIKRQVETDGND